MQGLAFNPPLHWRAQIRTPKPAEAHEVRLIFRASLDSANYEEAQREGIRVEVWTNASMFGEWIAVPFREVLPADALENPSAIGDEGSHTLRLSVDVPDAKPKVPNDYQYPHDFEALLTIPNNTYRAFSYTFRLVYASGEIRWLGAFGSDGTFEILPEGLDLFIERPSAWYPIGDAVEIFTAVHGTSAGKLNTQSVSWSGWSISDTSLQRYTENIPFPNEISGKTTLYLIPQYTQPSFLEPPSLVFSMTSQDSHLSIDASGSITFHSTDNGILERRVHNPLSDSDDTLPEIFHRFSQNEIIAKSSDAILLSFSPISHSSLHTIFALPISSKSAQGGISSSLSLDSSTLIKLIKKSSLSDSIKTCVSLFCPDSNDYIFYDLSCDTPTTSNVKLHPPKLGGGFMVSPVYDMTEDGSASWQLAFPHDVLPPQITQSSPSPSEPQHEPSTHPLPTPPASPRLEEEELDRKYGFTLFSELTLETPGVREDGPAVSESSSSVADPELETDGASNFSPASDVSTTEDRRLSTSSSVPTTNVAESSIGALSMNRSAVGNTSLRAYLYTLFSILRWFLRTLPSRLFFRLPLLLFTLPRLAVAALLRLQAQRGSTRAVSERVTERWQRAIDETRGILQTKTIAANDVNDGTCTPSASGDLQQNHEADDAVPLQDSEQESINHTYPQSGSENAAVEIPDISVEAVALETVPLDSVIPKIETLHLHVDLQTHVADRQSHNKVFSWTLTPSSSLLNSHDTTHHVSFLVRSKDGMVPGVEHVQVVVDGQTVSPEMVKMVEDTISKTTLFTVSVPALVDEDALTKLEISLL